MWGLTYIRKTIRRNIIILTSASTARFDSDIVRIDGFSKSMLMMAAKCYRRFGKEGTAANGETEQFFP